VERRGAIEKGDFMTLVSRISACALAALMAIPAVAQTPRRRAVSPTGQTGATTQIVITAKDSNGVAVEAGAVSFGGQTLNTNANGQVALTLPIGKPSLISIEHPAFLPFSQAITAQVGGKYDVTLTGKPSVTIKLKNDANPRIVDIGTAQFSYAPAFSSNINTDKGNFCKEDGSDFAPDKTEFARILGPATPANAPQCCQFGSVLSANAEMKTGAKFLVYFKDNCSGNEVYFVGREKATGHYQYYKFTDIAEIDFP
jgi:hypothetical protein